MPPQRTNMSNVKPVKTERTHEENQERAYIAASRRSDRSLEARIESARRASEIHKRRTGRALRVTEQDVVNEEMYEEEDDDLPAQYQRLSAHLQSGSLMFNRKLHDYIATQTAVRNQFLQQYPPLPFGHGFGHHNSQFSQSMSNPMMQPTMLPPQMFHQSPQTFNQTPQPFSPQAFQQGQQSQQGYRHNPYPVPNRSHIHQRSASIATPQQMSGYQQANQDNSGTVSTPTGEEQRRLSLPPHVLEQQTVDGSRPSVSRSNTSHSLHQQPASPQVAQSAASTPPSTDGQTTLQSGSTTPSSTMFMSNYFPTSQVLNMNPLSMSLPPESQQFVGSALDPNDPRTSIFMAGSDNIPQPFTGTYTYNPNPKPSRPATDASSGMNQTLFQTDNLKLNTNAPMAVNPSSAMSEDSTSPYTTMNSSTYEMGTYGDAFQHVDFSQAGNSQWGQEEFDSDLFLNFDK